MSDISLSPQQIKAAELLAKGHSQQEVGDAVGVSRRTILRWLKQEDFKNLSYALIAPAAQSQKQAPQPSPPPHRQIGGLKVEDLVPDALEAIRLILQDPEARSADKLKAAALVGQWSGLEYRGKMHEMQCLKALIEAGWIGDSVLEAIVDGGAEFTGKVRKSLGWSDQAEKNLYEEFFEKIKEDPSPEFSGEGSLVTQDGGQLGGKE